MCHKSWREESQKNDPDRYLEYHKTHYRTKRGRYIAKAVKKNRDLVARSFSHEKSEVEKVYDTCPDGSEVDHEIPINHPLVCGLHCKANLQHLTKEENRKKGNNWTQK